MRFNLCIIHKSAPWFSRLTLVNLNSARDGQSLIRKYKYGFIHRGNILCLIYIFVIWICINLFTRQFLVNTGIFASFLVNTNKLTISYAVNLKETNSVNIVNFSWVKYMPRENYTRRWLFLVFWEIKTELKRRQDTKFFSARRDEQKSLQEFFI